MISDLSRLRATHNFNFTNIFNEPLFRIVYKNVKNKQTFQSEI